MALALRTAGPGDLRVGPDGDRGAAVPDARRRQRHRRASGPIGALGVAVAMVAMLTLLPAWLVIWGRRAFWPRDPALRHARASTRRTAPGGASATASRAARGGCGSAPSRCCSCSSLGLLNFDTGLTSGNGVPRRRRGRRGPGAAREGLPERLERADRHHRARPGAGRRRAHRGRRARRASSRCARSAQTAEDGVLLAAVLERDPYSTEAFDLIPGIRAAAKRAGGPQTLVGGGTAVEYDLREAAARDNKVIVPIALLVVLLILIVLLRALVAPLMLIATVVLSFAASLGVGGGRLRRDLRLPRQRPVAAAVRLHLPRRAGDRLQHLPHGARARGDAPPRHARGDAARPGGDRRGHHVGRASCSRACSPCSASCRSSSSPRSASSSRSACCWTRSSCARCSCRR